jgi:hypothetical protein
MFLYLPIAADISIFPTTLFIFKYVFSFKNVTFRHPPSCSNDSTLHRETKEYVGCCLLWRCGPTRSMVSSFLRFQDHTRRRTTVGRTPLDERSSGRRETYLTTYNTHERQISMPPAGFESTIPASEGLQTHALDRAGNILGHQEVICCI